MNTSCRPIYNFGNILILLTPQPFAVRENLFFSRIYSILDIFPYVLFNTRAERFSLSILLASHESLAQMIRQGIGHEIFFVVV